MEQQTWHTRALRLGIRFLTRLGFVFALVSFTPLDVWWARQLAGKAYHAQGDVLIVLSGAMFEDGVMGWNSYLRTLYAGRNFAPGGFKEIVLSGGPGPHSNTPVAIAMSQYLRAVGVPAEAIRLETRAGSTRENALFTKQLLDSLPGQKVLLTSDYHMFRARRVFAKVGLEVLPQPIPDVAKRAGTWRGRWPAFLDLVTETCKVGYYELRGWI